jgi:diguanylate cyclase (GGDEF)-like protein
LQREYRYNTPVEIQAPLPRPDVIEAVAALTRAFGEAPASRLDLLLQAARQWTGADRALLTVFAATGLDVRASAGTVSSDGHESALADPTLALSARSGAIVLHESEDTSLLAVPIYAAGEVMGVLEVWSDRPGAHGRDAVPALQVLAGMAAAILSPGTLGAAAPPSTSMPRYHTLHDPLTGLPGRALLFDRLHQAIRLARRDEAPISVLLVGLTNYGELATRLGQEAAAPVVQEFARRTRATLRASDTVARAAEDRLAVVLPGANAIGALGTVKKILRAIAAPLPVSGQHVGPRGTAGIAIFPEHGEEAEVLLDRAADALRHAIENGVPAHTYGE